MNISLFTDYGALNSKAVFNAIAAGLTRLGHVVTYNDITADCAVIWSVLWAGRMAPNKMVFELFSTTERPVIVAEVGMIQRGTTWKLMGVGTARQYVDVSEQRASRLGLRLSDWRTGGDNVLVVAQRTQSQQWATMPPIDLWLADIVTNIRQVSERPIVIRAHPRERILKIPQGVILESPVPLLGTYDSFDFPRSLTHAHVVVNWNSSPASQAIIAGVPAVCGECSLAAAVGTPIERIEDPVRADRTEWIERIAHTEWTIAEITSGEPLARLIE